MGDFVDCSFWWVWAEVGNGWNYETDTRLGGLDLSCLESIWLNIDDILVNLES